jgi:cyclic-di-GMP-binding protein
VTTFFYLQINAMPTFDIVSELDNHEVTNAVDQANKEVSTRFDFKGSNASFELDKDNNIVMKAESTFQLQQMLPILFAKMGKRGIDIASMETGKIQDTGKTAQQSIALKQGIESDIAKKIVKLIKDKKLKVQAAINGDKLRVTGKKRDDLQEVIQMLRSEDVGQPLQFNNFRD